MNRTERLIAITEHLRARRTGVTAAALAERFGVSLRTMYRDLDALRAAHFPLNSEAGRGGGYVLDRAYTLPPVNFSVEEATLLLWAAEWMTRHRLVPFLQTIDDAAAKVRAALPPKTAAAVRRRANDVSFIGVPAIAVDPEVRRAIEAAWLRDQPVRITYGHGRDATERTIRIRSVVVDRRETLLNCDDLDKREARQFSLHRIAAACVAPQVA